MELKQIDDTVKRNKKRKGIRQSVQHLSIIEINDIWETQKQWITDAMIKYDLPTLNFDYSASDTNKKFDNYFTEKDNALKQNWIEDGFGNFPYSKQLEFMRVAWNMHVKNNISLLLLAYNKTDTEWWHEYVEDKAEVHFIRGRLKFMLDGKIPRYCSECRIRYYDEELYCNNKIETDGVIVECGERTNQNTAPYPSCWIIYRKK